MSTLHGPKILKLYLYELLGFFVTLFGVLAVGAIVRRQVWNMLGVSREVTDAITHQKFVAASVVQSTTDAMQGSLFLMIVGVAGILVLGGFLSYILKHTLWTYFHEKSRRLDMYQRALRKSGLFVLLFLGALLSYLVFTDIAIVIVLLLFVGVGAVFAAFTNALPFIHQIWQRVLVGLGAVAYLVSTSVVALMCTYAWSARLYALWIIVFIVPIFFLGSRCVVVRRVP